MTPPTPPCKGPGSTGPPHRRFARAARPGHCDIERGGATLSSIGTGAGAIYEALIDGVQQGTLLPHLSSTTAGPFLSNVIGPAAFGTPIPSQPGPAALATIGINIDFTLTPGDSATFTSVFVVEPIPEPGTGMMVGLGLIALAARRRGRATH